MRKRILYGVANYEEIVTKNGYFVDKTQYIEKLESIENPVFLRPRRFGKSLWCRILECYYSIRMKDRFDELFGHTWIGQNPTALKNAFIVLHLDFSTVDYTGNLADIKASFDSTCNYKMKALVNVYRDLFHDQVEIDISAGANDNLKAILSHVSQDNPPPLYVIIDEYDNFVNQLITGRKDHLYHQITGDDSFLKAFFKTLKEGRKTGAIANVFITGVLPITMDELASAYNIARFITLEKKFENMLGFTQSELDELLNAIFQDDSLDSGLRHQVNALMRTHYNGYHFVSPDGEAIYNSTLVSYCLYHLCDYQEIPEFLTDMILRTDLSWVKRITSAYEGSTEEFVNQLLLHDTIRFDKNFMMAKFDMRQFFHKSFFPISFFYLGMLTREDDFLLKLPNLNMRQIFAEYFNELNQIDVSTRYTEIMQAFVVNPDIASLFAGYWREYVSQLPEAVFVQMNENFIRTTFYELCSRFLSTWLMFTVERSYPKGKSDLEFMGRYNQKFAGRRWIIEFKYFSNAELIRTKTRIDEFLLRVEDTEQIIGYAEGAKQEEPVAVLNLYVIYCFGNQGFRVFDVTEVVS
jgi:Predicted AAA-ATPase/PD-(D/E)XK nuclease superfamily